MIPAWIAWSVLGAACLPLIYYATLSEQEKRRGTAEADIWRTDVLEQGRAPGQQLTVTRGPAPDQIAALLQLEGADEVAIRHRLRLVDGTLARP